VSGGAITGRKGSTNALIADEGSTACGDRPHSGARIDGRPLADGVANRTWRVNVTQDG
jgi:hypothetical protein